MKKFFNCILFLLLFFAGSVFADTFHDVHDAPVLYGDGLRNISTAISFSKNSSHNVTFSQHDDSSMYASYSFQLNSAVIKWSGGNNKLFINNALIVFPYEKKNWWGKTWQASFNYGKKAISGEQSIVVLPKERVESLADLTDNYGYAYDRAVENSFMEALRHCEAVILINLDYYE